MEFSRVGPREGVHIGAPTRSGLVYDSVYYIDYHNRIAAQ